MRPRKYTHREIWFDPEPGWRERGRQGKTVPPVSGRQGSLRARPSTWPGRHISAPLGSPATSAETAPAGRPGTALTPPAPAPSEPVAPEPSPRQQAAGSPESELVARLWEAVRRLEEIVTRAGTPPAPVFPSGRPASAGPSAEGAALEQMLQWLVGLGQNTTLAGTR